MSYPRSINKLSTELPLQTENVSIDWWRGAVIYQVYPRSFQDTSGNGVGDLPGIIQRLPYIASLGVDALWISPFFRSPMKDYGYDVSDFTAVDPLFGCIEDFKSLLNKAHELGLKVIIDQVPSHTSDQHDWFIESRKDKTNPKADWYVWADPMDDGSAPNNWWSIFGGSAWEWDETRQQYYLHNFLKSQPDLNYHSAEVREAILKEITFWLELGVDGFRLDAINFCYHDAQLRSNPEKPLHERKARGFSSNNPYASQYHKYDSTQPENIEFLRAIRSLLNRYPGTTALGEVNSDNSLQTMTEYTDGGDKLHMAYSFELLGDEFGPKYIASTVSTVCKEMKQGWPCWAISNHDVERVVSRWGKNKNPKLFSKMSLALSASLRGSVCVYQGEELGLSEANVDYEELRDPFGITFWPEFKGRDGCRTPMPWKPDSRFADFSDTAPWLPIPENHKSLAVSVQEDDIDSTLNFYRQFLNWRKQYLCLVCGEIDFVDVTNQFLSFRRSFEGHSIIACFNLSSTSYLWHAPSKNLSLDFTATRSSPAQSGRQWLFAPFAFGFFIEQ